MKSEKFTETSTTRNTPRKVPRCRARRPSPPREEAQRTGSATPSTTTPMYFPEIASAQPAPSTADAPEGGPLRVGERGQEGPRHAEEERGVLLHVMGQLVNLVVQRERHPGHEPGPPAAPEEGEQRKHDDRAGHERSRNAAPDLDHRLRLRRRVQHVRGQPRRREQQHRVMVIELPRDDLLHLARLVRVIEIGERVVPKPGGEAEDEQHEARAEERRALQPVDRGGRHGAGGKNGVGHREDVSVAEPRGLSRPAAVLFRLSAAPPRYAGGGTSGNTFSSALYDGFFSIALPKNFVASSILPSTAAKTPISHSRSPSRSAGRSVLQ